MTNPTKLLNQIKKLPWTRIRKTVFTLFIVVCVFYSYTVQQSFEEFKKSVGPIGTNPAQYSPVKFYTAELGTEHLYPTVNFLTDTIVGHNYSNNMLTRLGTVSDIRSGLATTASLASYATSASLSGYVPTSRTITINGTAFDLSANRSWTIPGNTYSAGTGLSLTGSVFANAAPDQTVSVTASNGLVWTGTYPNFFITKKRQETYSGTTNASGIYTVAFGASYSVAPNIQANIINGADNQNLRITAVSTTGFTVLARTRVDVVGLLPTWNNATGLAIDVIVTEK